VLEGVDHWCGKVCGDRGQAPGAGGVRGDGPAQMG
jgi:hypothetical protein